MVQGYTGLEKEGMNKEIRIIFVEDVPEDAEAVEHALHRGGLAFELCRVDTRDAFVRELELDPPDVILSDHGLPSFDGFAALAIAREKCLGVPFIFVTGALTREMEIEKLSPGVTDYVLKHRLDGLAPIILRALHHTSGFLEDKQVVERERILKQLLALLEEYEAKGGLLPICASCKKIRDSQNVWHPMEIFFNRHLGLNFTHGICPDCVRQYRR